MQASEQGLEIKSVEVDGAAAYQLVRPLSRKGATAEQRPKRQRLSNQRSAFQELAALRLTWSRKLAELAEIQKRLETDLKFQSSLDEETRERADLWKNCCHNAILELKSRFDSRNLEESVMATFIAMLRIDPRKFPFDSKTGQFL